MAKKKDKPQIINNIQELNLEIDYDKLAEAIVKAQEKSTTLPESESKIGFWKAVWLVIRNKEPKNGKKTAYLLAEVMAWMFNALAICGVILTFIVGYGLVSQFSCNINVFQFVAKVIASIMLLGTALILSLIFRGIANEIKAEKDRNYIISVFSGIVSFAALIVALVALFKGVG